MNRMEKVPAMLSLLALASLLHACGVATAIDGADDGGVSVEVALELIDRAYAIDGYTGEQPRVPGRGANIELVSASTGTVVDSAVSDEEGRAQLLWPAEVQRAYVRAVAELPGERITMQVLHPETQNELYALRSEEFSRPPESVVRLGIHDDVDHPANRALHVTDTTWLADRFLIPLVDPPARSLQIVWGPGYAYSCGSCYGQQRILLGGSPEDPDEFDDDIILHEIGHFISAVWSRDDSPGGRHVGDPIDPRLAWGEGLATAISSMVRQSGDYVDFRESYVRYFDIEGASDERFYGTTTGQIDGPVSEYLVASLLYDIFSGAENAGFAGRGADPIFEVLTERFTQTNRVDVGYAGVDLADFLYHAQCVDDLGDELLPALVEERLFPMTLDPASCAHKIVPGDRLTEGTAGVPDVDPRFFRLQRVGANVYLQHPSTYAYSFEVRVQERGPDASDRSVICPQNGCLVTSSFNEDSVLIVTGIWPGYEPFGFGLIGERALREMQGDYEVVARGSQLIREYQQP